MHGFFIKWFFLDLGTIFSKFIKLFSIILSKLCQNFFKHYKNISYNGRIFVKCISTIRVGKKFSRFTLCIVSEKMIPCMAQMFLQFSFFDIFFKHVCKFPSEYTIPYDILQIFCESSSNLPTIHKFIPHFFKFLPRFIFNFFKSFNPIFFKGSSK